MDPSEEGLPRRYSCLPDAATRGLVSLPTTRKYRGAALLPIPPAEEPLIEARPGEVQSVALPDPASPVLWDLAREHWVLFSGAEGFW